MNPGHSPLGQPLLGGALAVLGAIAYGINIPTARLAGLGGVSGGNITFQRSFLLVFMLALIIGLTGRSFRIRPGETSRIVIMGLLAGGVGLGYLSALNFVPVASAVAVFYTFPLLLILAAPWTGGGRITRWRIMAFSIAFVGILLCVGPSFEQLDWRGLALAFAASCACAVLFAITATVKQDRLSLMFWTQVFALPVLLVGVLLSGFSTAAAVWSIWPIMLICALGFYVGYACQLLASGMMKPASLGLVFLIEPVVAIATAALLLDEAMLPLQYAGMALVIAGLGLDAWTQDHSAATSVP